MKSTTLLAISICAAFTLTAVPSFAAEHGHRKGEHAVKVPDTAQGIVTEIRKHHGQVSDSIKARQLNAVHDHSEAIIALAMALPTKVAADKKARVEGTARNLAKVADAMHEAADAGDQSKTEAHIKKLNAVLAQLDTQMK